MTKFAKLLIRFCLGVLALSVVSPALVVVSVIAMIYDKLPVSAAAEPL